MVSEQQLAPATNFAAIALVHTLIQQRFSTSTLFVVDLVLFGKLEQILLDVLSLAGPF